MQADIGEAAESSTTDLQAAGEERYWAWFGPSKTQKPPPVTNFLQQSHLS